MASKGSSKQPQNGGVDTKAVMAAGLGIVFLAAVPVTTYLTQTGGIFEKLLNTTVSTIVWAGTAGASSAISKNGMIPALSALYLALTFAISSAGSGVGAVLALGDKRDITHPRAQMSMLTGFPLRLYSAHVNLMENFSGFALVAGLTQAIAPGDQQLVNLLGLHVLAKCFVYYPSYLSNIVPTRAASHILATSSMINVAWKLAQRA